MTDIREVTPGSVWYDRHLGTPATVTKVVRELVFYEIDGRPYARDVYAFVARYEMEEDE
jgi:hypothetical protein